MNDYGAHLQDIFQSFGPVETRRMFGGCGVFRDGLMFALVVDDALYLKADRETVHEFESRGLERFGYRRGGKTVRLRYYAAPAEIFDDLDEAARWATLAYDAALRSARA